MSFDFIIMLTANDETVPDARARLSQVLGGGARHIGFKDVGLPLAELKILTQPGACVWHGRIVRRKHEDEVEAHGTALLSRLTSSLNRAAVQLLILLTSKRL